jgi:hypothetical protein
MLSVAHIHQSRLIFSKSALSQPGNQCPLETRLAPSTVRSVLFAVPRRELASTGNQALGRVKARRGPAIRIAALKANPALADTSWRGRIWRMSQPLWCLGRGCDRFKFMSISVEQP